VGNGDVHVCDSCQQLIYRNWPHLIKDWRVRLTYMECSQKCDMCRVGHCVNCWGTDPTDGSPLMVRSLVAQVLGASSLTV
jgi:hypothetical protein